MAEAYKNTSGKRYSGGGIPPVSHPQNCRNECPYGHDKDFCFPCYKKLMEEMRSKKGAKNGI